MSGLVDRKRNTNTRGVPSPLVEAVTKHPGDWNIQNQDWGGKTSNADHEMWVPLNDDACTLCGGLHNDMIRAHELMHTKLSPQSFGPVKVEVGKEEIPVSAALIEVAEEYRINHSIAVIEGGTLVDDGWCAPAIGPGVTGVMDQGKFTEVIKLAVAGGPGADEYVVGHLMDYQATLAKAMSAKSTSEAVKAQLRKKLKVVEALAEAIPAYVAAAARIMARDDSKLPSWSQVEQLAAFLEINLKDFNRQLKELLTDPPPDLGILDDRLAEWAGPPDPKTLDPEHKVVKHGNKLVMGESGKRGKTKDDVRWGKVSRGITEAKMPLSIPAWKLQRANRAVEEGTIPRYMHRWPTDKRVFHRTKRLPGGSLLVDDSGSMGLSPEGLNDILEAAPVATVAVYAGRDQADGGEIRVVAKDGKRARTEDLSIYDYGGNGIDGPALEWLGSQPYPRIWVTDGGVTDKTFGFDSRTVEAAKDLVLKHRITVVESAEEAAKLMKSGDFAR